MRGGRGGDSIEEGRKVEGDPWTIRRYGKRVKSVQKGMRGASAKTTF